MAKGHMPVAQETEKAMAVKYEILSSCFPELEI